MVCVCRLSNNDTDINLTLFVLQQKRCSSLQDTLGATQPVTDCLDLFFRKFWSVAMEKVMEMPKLKKSQNRIQKNGHFLHSLKVFFD